MSYAKITFGMLVSDERYYDPAEYDPPDWEDEFTPDEWPVAGRIEAATTPGTAISTSILTSCQLLAVMNLDDTNFVTLTWRSAANGVNDNKVKLLPGEFFVTRDVTYSTNPTLVADTLACDCAVLVLGT